MEILVTEQSENGSNLQLKGSLVISVVKSTWSSLQEHLSGEGTLEVDLSEIDEIDSAGFQILIQMKRAHREGFRKVAYRAHSAGVLQFLELYGLAGEFGDKLVIPSAMKGKLKFPYGLKKRTKKAG